MDTRIGVSVVMTVNNGQAHLREAVQSVLSQTLGDFELIVVDDGSTDFAPTMLDEFADADPRLRVIHRPATGLCASLNFAISQARSELVAITGQGDVCVPGRLELQASYMHSHPEIGLVGSATHLVDADGNDIGRWTPALDHFEIREALIRANQFALSTVMFRKSTFESLGGYRDLPHAFDYDLWLRLAKIDRVANFQQPLVQHRERKLSAIEESGQFRLAWQVRMESIERGDYPRSALLKLMGPAVAAKMPVSLRTAARRVFRPRAA